MSKRSSKAALMVLCAGICGSASMAQAQSVLVFSEGRPEFRYERVAADNLGLEYVHIINDREALTVALDSGRFDFAIIYEPAQTLDPGFELALERFIDTGNRVHMSFWNLDANPELQRICGVASTVDFFSPRVVFNSEGHPSWGDVRGPINPGTADVWNDNGDLLERPYPFSSVYPQCRKQFRASREVT